LSDCPAKRTGDVERERGHVRGQKDGDKREGGEAEGNVGVSKEFGR
jgi:hypothetical protein